MPTPKYRIDPMYGCHLVMEGLNSAGYASVWLSHGVAVLAHVYAWQQANGKIVQKGMQVDHCCRRRNCINPLHLECVTANENQRRKSYRYRNRRKTCAAGHPLFEYGRRTPEAGFVCLRCAGLK